MNKWHVTEGAAVELENIIDYITEHDGPDRADAMLEKLHRAFHLIGEAPRAGVQKPRLTPPNIRWWLAVPFYVVYDCESSPIRIDHILHTARNLPDLFD
ncbi:MAG TPA: type II toxin-antitoxin system RelE/ParE family toxin [Phycisphaerales bacterium]|nr:type II toxin-antitoxin system RelE/ParE family toxin [Phycisphaerales bacterium]